MTLNQLDALTHANLDDLISSFGWENNPLAISALRYVFARPAQKFAGQIVEFDNNVGRLDLAEAARITMQKLYVHDVRVHDHEHIPANGPVLFLSNHPGMTDTLGLFAAINRFDLKVIALHRPFLDSLSNVTKQLFFIDDSPSKRMNAVRQVSNHLRHGGSVLTFPAGEIEPDPLVYSGALEALKNWTNSAGVFIRFAPETRIVPVLVSGVIWEKTARHWLTRFKRTRFEREKFAAALQLLALILRDSRPNTIHVRFARPITVAETESTDTQVIHQVVISRMKELLETPTEGGLSILHHTTNIPVGFRNNPLTETV